MSAARQERKRYGAALAVAAACIVAAPLPLAASPAAMPAAKAATAERLVVDWHSGLAIDGYDPVAYFSEGKPALGSADFELSFGGAIWRFRNIGNRSAFMARPDVYMPQFGGYDPLGMVHGVAVAGNPTVWRISGERLFLFYDRARLRAFNADPQRIIAAADRKWPRVRRTLSP
jgi:hypothetical protein